MIKWIRDKVGITSLEKKNKELQDMVQYLKKEDLGLSLKLRCLERQFEKNNRVSADISMKDRSHLILSGNWKGKPYVSIYPIYEDEMGDFIKEFKYRFEGREFKIDSCMEMEALVY